MNLFSDIIVDEYVEWKKANPNNFTWWNYINIKADINIALAFAKFFSPEIIEHEGCLLLKDKFSIELFNSWKKECNKDKNSIEKMMNLYQLSDFFHININDNIGNEYTQKLLALGNVLKHYWTVNFKYYYPSKSISVEVFKENDEEYFITVFESLK